MKLIQHINGVVVGISNLHPDVAADGIAAVDSIPAFESKDGYNGVLKYGENGLYWDYEVVPVSDEISDAEALNIILGGTAE